MADKTKYFYRCHGYQGSKGIINAHAYEADRPLDDKAREQCPACSALMLEDLVKADKPLEEL